MMKRHAKMKKTTLSLLAGMMCVGIGFPVTSYGWFGRSNEEKTETTASEPATDTAASVPARPINVREAGEGTRVVTRAHMRLDSAEAETEFLQFVNARRRATEDLVVITRLVDEKLGEIDQFNQALRGEFGVNVDDNYQFDEESGTIYQLTPREDSSVALRQLATPEAIESSFDRSVFMVLTKEEEKDRFVRLVAAKQLSTEQARVLELLGQEKEIEVATLHQAMADRYSVSNDREYRYDADTRTLFELVPVPSGFDRNNPEAGQVTP